MSSRWPMTCARAALLVWGVAAGAASQAQTAGQASDVVSRESFRICDAKAFLALNIARNYLVTGRNRQSVLPYLNGDAAAEALAEEMFRRVDAGEVRHPGQAAADVLFECAAQQKMTVGAPRAAGRAVLHAHRHRLPSARRAQQRRRAPAGGVEGAGATEVARGVPDGAHQHRGRSRLRAAQIPDVRQLMGSVAWGCINRPPSAASSAPQPLARRRQPAAEGARRGLNARARRAAPLRRVTSPRVALKTLILGGYGHFGARVARALAGDARIELMIGGRDAARAAELAARLGADARGIVIDAQDDALTRSLRALGVELVVHTAGPFQHQDYSVALAAASAGAHYVDLADGRRFVCDFASHADAAFRDAGRWAISGASTVPALSSAVVDHLAAGWQHIDRIDICIAPAQAAPRGVATMAAVLSYCGEPIPVWRWRLAARARLGQPEPGASRACGRASVRCATSPISSCSRRAMAGARRDVSCRARGRAAQRAGVDG